MNKARFRGSCCHTVSLFPAIVSLRGVDNHTGYYYVVFFFNATRALHTDIPSQPGLAVQEASKTICESDPVSGRDESQCANGDEGGCGGGWGWGVGVAQMLPDDSTTFF